jgi:serine/threonine protein kinase
MPLSPGAQVGPYRIQSLIGQGGMSEVYRALDTKLEREVAIKVLPDALSGDPERRGADRAGRSKHLPAGARLT